MTEIQTVIILFVLTVATGLWLPVCTKRLRARRRRAIQLAEEAELCPSPDRVYKQEFWSGVIWVSLFVIVILLAR